MVEEMMIRHHHRRLSTGHEDDTDSHRRQHCLHHKGRHSLRTKKWRIRLLFWYFMSSCSITISRFRPIHIAVFVAVGAQQEVDDQRRRQQQQQQQQHTHHDDEIENSFFDSISVDPSCTNNNNNSNGDDDCYGPPTTTIEETTETTIETTILDASCFKGGDDIPEEDDEDDNNNNNETDQRRQKDQRREQQCTPKEVVEEKTIRVDKHWGKDPEVLKMRDQLLEQSKKSMDDSRPPILLLPGLASTRLVAWKFKKCLGALSSDIKVQDNVWLNINLVIRMGSSIDVDCMKQCLELGRNQTDTDDWDVGCKLRPDEGLDAIASLSPAGTLLPSSHTYSHRRVCVCVCVCVCKRVNCRNLVLISFFLSFFLFLGAFSGIGADLLVGGTNTVYAWLIQWLSDNLGYDVTNIVGLPYDWRLSPDKMERRDGFLSMMRRKIEATVASNKQPAIMVARKS
jgi:hypothetical protein